MCGICGFVGKNTANLDELKIMNDSLAHRGPDDHGEEIFELGNGVHVGFAQRRLSIIDLSHKGHQPMHSNDQNISVVFNGEIYNYSDLKKQLKNYAFQSESDTEVILAAYLQWGINFVEKINGMYAIALLDHTTGTVYLIRDRIGKKPLYYYVKNETIVFGSELKAIMAYPDFPKEINTDMIGHYLFHLCLNAPDTIFRDTYQLPPGSILKIQDGTINQYKYWDIAQQYLAAKDKQNLWDYEEAKEILKDMLIKSVSSRLIADVPVGAFLSGGYDSSLICAIAQKQRRQPLKTFCIGFHEKEFNEAVYAKKVADSIGSEHEELYIGEAELLSMVDDIPQYYDEPFADSSQIPMMFISHLARQKVSVVLSGDGGDELFGGYNIYTTLQKAQSLAQKGISGTYTGTEEEWLKNPIEYRIITDSMSSLFPAQAGASNYIHCIDKLLINHTDHYYYIEEENYKERRFDTARMLLDMDTYLPSDILTKVDRASMKYALECRCPILDKDILEFSLKLPWNFKDDNGNQKRILKDIAYEYIPKELLDRPKMGFSIPLDKWMRGPLKDRICDWINRDFLVRQGIFEPNETIKFVSEYLKNGNQGKWSGKNYAKIVWPFFIFQQWYTHYFTT